MTRGEGKNWLTESSRFLLDWLYDVFDMDDTDCLLYLYPKPDAFFQNLVTNGEAFNFCSFHFSVLIMCQEKRSGEENSPVSQDWQEQRIRWKCPMEPGKLSTSGENKTGWVPADPLPPLSGIWGKILVLKPNSVLAEYGQNVAFRYLREFLQQLVEHWCTLSTVLS